MIAFFKVVCYIPLYNGLIFLMGALPWIDAGVAVILFTVIVKLLLFPLSRRATETQFKMKQYEPEMNSIRDKFKDNREAQARATMEFYRQKGIKPFSSFLLIFIQIPILISLYYIFYSGGLPKINTEILYSFVLAPAIHMNFLGLVNIAGKSLVLAIIAGVAQFFQMKYSLPPLKPRGENDTFKEDLARGMNMQMKYMMPVFMAIVAYTSGAIALYLATSSLFTIWQELHIKKQLKFAGAIDKTKAKS